MAGGARGKNGASVPRWANGEGGGTGRVPAISAPAFTGRQQELAALGRTLAGPPAVVLVEGIAAKDGYQPVAKLARIIKGSSVTLNFSLNRS